MAVNHEVNHWSDAWLTRALPADYDCADLLVDVQGAHFARRVLLPQHAATLRSRDRQIASLSEGLGRPVDRPPREGDAVLMRAAGRARTLGHHVGTWCAPGGAPSVLHWLAGIGVCRHAIEELPARGLAVTGIYEWLV